MGHEVTPARAVPGWRPEDERLLSELAEEGAIAALWEMQAPPGAPTMPARARALARALGETAGGRDVVMLAVRGDAGPMGQALASIGIASAAPPLVHALACYLDRLADAYAGAAKRERDARDPAAAAEHAEIEQGTRVRALACWARLFDERNHLSALAQRAAGDALSPDDTERAAEKACLRAWDALGERARRAATTLDEDGSAALASLSRTGDACRASGVSSKSARALEARADSARAGAIADALATIEAALREVRHGNDVVSRAIPHLEALRRTWEWSGRDEAVERFAVDEVSTIAWDVYRKADWAALRALLAPLVEPFESLEARVLRDPTGQLAYSARCAQIFVFRSDAAADWVREWDYAERALRLCPTHRNGRLILANLCLSRALSTLDRSTLFTSAADLRTAEGLVERAEKLFPNAKKLDEAKKRLADARRRGARGASA